MRVGGTIFPNTFESSALSTTNNHNLESSNILGLIPTGRQDINDFNNLFLYSNINYDNTFVVLGNIFKGTLNLKLTDQSGSILPDTLTNNKSYNIKLELYFPEDKSLDIENNKKDLLIN